MSGSKLGFCLLHQVDGGIDAGPVVAVREFLYPPASRIPADFQTVYEKENLAFLADLFSRIIKKKTAFPITSQPEYLSSYWPRLHTLSHSWIDWSMPVDDLDRFVCAFDDPYAGSQTLWNETPVFLKKIAHRFQRRRVSFLPIRLGLPEQRPLADGGGQRRYADRAVRA